MSGLQDTIERDNQSAWNLSAGKLVCLGEMSQKKCAVRYVRGVLKFEDRTREELAIKTLDLTYAK